MKGDTIKAIGVIIILIGITAGVLMWKFGLGWVLMIIEWIGAAILGFSFVVSGQIVENQEKLISCLKHNEQNIESGKSKSEESEIEIVEGETMKQA